jgi:hypothetical protein
MPGVMAEYKGPDKTIDELADHEREARRKVIDQAFAYYEGEHKLALKNEPDGSNASVILNISGQALDDMVEFIGVPRLEIPGAVVREPGADGKLTTFKSEEQESLEAWWEDQELAEILADVFLSGFAAGHTFVRLYIDQDNSTQVALLDPRMVTVFWDATNIKRTLWYRLEWMIGDERRRQDIVPGWLVGGEGWQIIEYAMKKGGAKWEQVGQDPWPYPFAPVVEWKNRHMPHSYYGRGDVMPKRNDAINFAASNIQKINKHHAAPQTVLTGGSLGDEVETGPGTILEIPDPEAKLFNLEMQSELQSSLQFLDKLEARLFSEMRVVDMATIKDKLGQITNFGVRMLFVRMTNMLTTRRRLYGKGITEISRRAMTIMGTEVAQVTDIWPEMLPVNRLELVNTLKTEKEIGVLSEQTAAEDLGRDYDSERERREEETANGDDAVARQMERLGTRGMLQ